MLGRKNDLQRLEVGLQMLHLAATNDWGRIRRFLHDVCDHYRGNVLRTDLVQRGTDSPFLSFRFHSALKVVRPFSPD